MRRSWDDAEIAEPIIRHRYVIDTGLQQPATGPDACTIRPPPHGWGGSCRQTPQAASQGVLGSFPGRGEILR